MLRNPFLPALILGLAVAALSALFPKIPAAPGVRLAIIELEFARSAGEVYRVTGFGLTGDAVPDAGIVDAIRQNTAHDRWFIFAYSFFLAVCCAIAWKQSGSPMLLAGAVLAFAAGAFDFLENRQILLIMNQLDGDFGGSLVRLHVFTWLKWGSIVLVFGAFAPFAWHHGLLGKALAASALAGMLAGVVAALLQKHMYYIAFSGLVMLSFVTLLVFAALFPKRN